MTVALPPYAAVLGLSFDAGEAWQGAPRLVMPFGDRVIGRPGFLHGGALGGLLEMAALVTLRHALADDAAAIAPITLTIDYMRGGREKPTRAAGVVRRLGRRIANIDATAWQDDADDPIAAARLTFRLTR